MRARREHQLQPLAVPRGFGDVLQVRGEGRLARAHLARVRARARARVRVRVRVRVGVRVGVGVGVRVRVRVPQARRP